MINMQTPQQAPGQAPMPGQAGGIASVMPQPSQGGTPTGISSDRIPDLAKLNEQMLSQLFSMSMSGQIQKPSPISILAAVSERQKQQQAMKAVANSIAQGQNAQNQQTGTVADQVMGPLMQRNAAHGGAMHGYAGGGIVAFQKGGMTDAEKAELMSLGVSAATIEDAIRQGLTYEDLRRRSFSVSRPVTSVIASPEEQVVPEEVPLAKREMQGEAVKRELIPGAALARAAKSLAIGDRPDFYKQQLADPDEIMREIEGKTQQLPQTSLPPDFVVPPPQRMMDTRAIPAPRATGDEVAKTRPVSSAGASGLAALVEKDIPEVKTAYDKIAAAAGLTPEQQKMLEEKQKAEMDVRQATEAGRKTRAEESFARSAKSYADVLAGQEGLFGQRGLFELAASIDPRKGYLFGSLAKGASGILAREQEEKRKAQTAYEVAQQKFSEELNALDGIKLATAERDTAILNNNMNAAREAEIKRQQLVVEYNKLKRDRAVAEQKAAIDAYEAQSKRISAESAGAQAAAARDTAAAAREQTAEIQRGNQLNAANQNVASAYERVEKTMEARFGSFPKLMEMDPEKFKKTNPQQYEQITAERDKLYKSIIEPAIKRRNQLLARASGEPGAATSGVEMIEYDAEGKRKQQD